MNRIIKNKSFFLVFLIFLTGCIGEQKNYFPLNDGRVWNYDIKINPGVEERINYKKTNYSLGKQYINKSGKKLKIQPIVRENNNIYYYSEDQNGILRQGVQLNGSDNIRFEDEKIVEAYHFFDPSLLDREIKAAEAMNKTSTKVPINRNR